MVSGHHGSECLRKLCTRLIAGLVCMGSPTSGYEVREVDTLDAFGPSSLHANQDIIPPLGTLTNRSITVSCNGPLASVDDSIALTIPMSCNGSSMVPLFSLAYPQHRARYCRSTGVRQTGR